MSEGHPEDDERDIDFEDITDDEEVELNLPREGAVELDHRWSTSDIYRGPPLWGRR